MHKPFKLIQLKWQFKCEHISDKSITSMGFNYEVVMIVKKPGFEHKAHISAKSCQQEIPQLETTEFTLENVSVSLSKKKKKKKKKKKQKKNKNKTNKKKNPQKFAP